MGKKGKVYATELLFAVGLTAITVMVQRAVSRPDFAKTVGMRSALTVKRFADAQADMWTGIAGRAAQSYNGFKL